MNKLEKKYNFKVKAFDVIYNLEKSGVKGQYTRDEIYTAIEESQ